MEHGFYNPILSMKKTTIYILSLLVIVVLGFSVLLPSGQIFTHGAESFSAGFEAGKNGDQPAEGTPLQLQFQPKVSTMLQPSDSIQFDNSDKMPVVIDSMTVLVPDSKLPKWTEWAYLTLTPLQIILFCFIIWKFLKFIINVSKSRIFVKQNVRYLRQTSCLLIAIALLQTAAGLVQDVIFSQFAFKWEGYVLGAYWTFPWSNLLLGTFGMLLAQIWSYGIEIKEDYELTI